MTSTSIIPEEHRTFGHTGNEKCNAPYILCNDVTCSLYQQHRVCSVHPFHPGDRVVNWEFRNKYGWIYQKKPTIFKNDHVTYVKYDDDNEKIHARFGKCACHDLFVLTNVPRDLSQAKTRSRFIERSLLEKIKQNN